MASLLTSALSALSQVGLRTGSVDRTAPMSPGRQYAWAAAKLYYHTRMRRQSPEMDKPSGHPQVWPLATWMLVCKSMDSVETLFRSRNPLEDLKPFLAANQEFIKTLEESTGVNVTSFLHKQLSALQTLYLPRSGNAQANPTVELFHYHGFHQDNALNLNKLMNAAYKEVKGMRDDSLDALEAKHYYGQIKAYFFIQILKTRKQWTLGSDPAFATNEADGPDPRYALMLLISTIQIAIDIFVEIHSHKVRAPGGSYGANVRAHENWWSEGSLEVQQILSDVPIIFENGGLDKYVPDPSEDLVVTEPEPKTSNQFALTATFVAVAAFVYSKFTRSPS